MKWIKILNSINRKPDFLIIGVQKSATTWLHERLRKHPDVYMPCNELHYFDKNDNFKKGDQWYLKNFKHALRHQIIGEKTPDYIWTNCDGTPGLSENKHKRIHSFSPNIKMIVILRNPIERIVSAVHHNMRLGRIPARMTIDELMKSEAHEVIVDRMLKRGLYSKQLRAYYEIFEKSQIQVLFHDDIKLNPDHVLKRVQGFLGIDELPASDDNAKRYNEFNATELGALLIGMSSGALNSMFLKLDRYLLSHLPFSKISYPVLGDFAESQLIDYYAHDLEELPDLICQDLPVAWTSSSSLGQWGSLA
jgi:hypothetical protein